MLILKRPKGTAIVINDNVTIHFLGKDKVGIEAPADVRVLREELRTTNKGAA